MFILYLYFLCLIQVSQVQKLNELKNYKHLFISADIGFYSLTLHQNIH